MSFDILRTVGTTLNSDGELYLAHKANLKSSILTWLGVERLRFMLV